MHSLLKIAKLYISKLRNPNKKSFSAYDAGHSDPMGLMIVIVFMIL